MSDKLTLKQFFDAQPYGEVAKIKAKLIKNLDITKSSLNGYIYAIANVPVKRRKQINKLLKTELEYTAPAKEVLKKQARRIKTKLQAHL